MIEPAIAGKRFLEALILPPAGPLLLAALSVLLLRRRQWPARGMVLLCLVVAWVGCTRGAGYLLAELVETEALAMTPAQLQLLMAEPVPPGAVVVLGGGSRRDLREQSGPDVLKPVNMQRAQTAARLARWSGLPLLVSGGSVERGSRSEAQLLEQVLREDFGQTVKWVEGKSLDTGENAREAAAMLVAAGVRRIVLVTDSLHLPRAARSFEHHGLAVVQAPSGFSGAQGGSTALAWLPTPEGMTLTWAALHELSGAAWYRLMSKRLQ